MADQYTEDSLVHQAFLYCNRNFPAQLDVLPLAGAMHGAVADGEAVYTGLFEKFHRVERIGIGRTGAEHMVLHPCKHTQLPLDSNAPFVRIFDHLTGDLNVLLKRQAGTVDHHAGVTARNRRLAGVDVPTMVEMERNRNRAGFPIPFHRCRNIFCAGLLIFKGRIHKIYASAHEPVCEVSAL